MRPAEITGTKGELIDRLVALVGDTDAGGAAWHEVGFYVADCVGPHALARMFLEAGDPRSGVDQGRKRRKSLPSTREECLERLGRRLVALVEGGVSEEFLVRSLRDAVSSKLGEFTDPAEVERRRAEIRESLAAATDATGRVQPQVAAAFAAPIAPVSAEQASRSRTEKLDWDRRSEAVSEGVIQRWGLANDVLRP